MPRRVSFTPPSYVTLVINWNEQVEKPRQDGYFAEAYVVADALIEDLIQGLVRQLYSDCQELLNLFLSFRSHVGGRQLLDILKCKTVIDEELYQRILHFKKARNLVTHDPHGEYALIVCNERISYTSNDEFQSAAKKEANKWLDAGREIFDSLTDIQQQLVTKGTERYFSRDWYETNPFKKILRNQFPKETQGK